MQTIVDLKDVYKRQKYTPSGQNYRFAINQYKNTRNKNTKIFDVMTGAVVNFAMDENEAYMSTYINGKDTVFLLSLIHICKDFW